MDYSKERTPGFIRGLTSCLILWLSVTFLMFLCLTRPTAGEKGRMGIRTQLAPSHTSTVCVYLATESPDTFKVGNGLIVNAEGYVLTTKHLVRGTTGLMTLKCCCGDTICEDYDAEFLDSSYTSDLALLKIKHFPYWDKKCRPCVFADDRTLFSEGTEVELDPYRCTGYKGRAFSLTGAISSLSDEMLRIALDLAVQEGASGSPVKIRGSNVVIGMVSECESVVEAAVIMMGEKRWVIIAPPPSIKVSMFARAVPVDQIKTFLERNNVSPLEQPWESLGPSPYGGNPSPQLEKDYREEHLGMLNLIQRYIDDILWKYDQFECRLDPDVLLETRFEATSFRDKLLLQSKEERTAARQKAEDFFIRGLMMKATRKKGIQAGVEYFYRAVGEDSTFCEPRYQIAIYHMRCTADSMKIVEQINKGLEYDAMNGELLRTYAMFHLYYHNMDAARVFLEEACKHLPKTEKDPRIPFYRGLTFDPYWRTIDSFQTWSEDFRRTAKRNPAFPEIQVQKDSLLFAVPRWQDNIPQALSWFDSSSKLRPGYVRPVNSIAWIQANEILRGDSSYISLLRNRLREMTQFVGYGLSDARVFNTLALGYAALKDCEAAKAYVDSAEVNSNALLLPPKFKKDLELENERVKRICDLLGSQSD